MIVYRLVVSGDLYNPEIGIFMDTSGHGESDAFWKLHRNHKGTGEYRCQGRHAYKHSFVERFSKDVYTLLSMSHIKLLKLDIAQISIVYEDENQVVINHSAYDSSIIR